jgi:hypothetical protein
LKNSGTEREKAVPGDSVFLEDTETKAEMTGRLTRARATSDIPSRNPNNARVTQRPADMIRQHGS